MKSFETRIVKTWKPSVLLNIIFIVLLLGGGSIISIFDVKEAWLRISGSVAYMLGLLGALSQSFVKPKNLGEILIDETKIKIILANSEKVHLISEIKAIGFNYKGYASFWKYTLYGNKNRLYFTTNSDEKYNYEIILQNKQKKEEFKNFLNELNAANSIRIQKFGIFSF
jgi:hypothetical protein